mmetsp:Transcript_11722/g.40497  ORF Transcript_11722/g.40497 Transcript_11722/m.40497 type:complete len:249 (-) Transcript_11722:1373-2119(-)
MTLEKRLDPLLPLVRSVLPPVQFFVGVNGRICEQETVHGVPDSLQVTDERMAVADLVSEVGEALREIVDTDHLVVVLVRQDCFSLVLLLLFVLCLFKNRSEASVSGRSDVGRGVAGARGVEQLVLVRLDGLAADRALVMLDLEVPEALEAEDRVTAGEAYLPWVVPADETFLGLARAPHEPIVVVPLDKVALQLLLHVDPGDSVLEAVVPQLVGEAGDEVNVPGSRALKPPVEEHGHGMRIALHVEGG